MIRSFVGLLVCMSLLSFLNSCSNNSGKIRQISVAELRAEMERDSNLALIDVRTATEYAAARVPYIKARIDFQHITDQIDSLKLAKDQPIYLICRSGRRSLIAAKELLDMGYLQPVNVRGGTLAWTDAGYPVIKQQ